MRTICVFLLVIAATAHADSWKVDPIWHDGLVEKAVYTASRVIYGKPRAYEAIFFTNKEQHDTKTLTKAVGNPSTIEVWKHNQIESIPTPNYTYHHVTTIHLTVDELELTRLDCSSQEYCGTSFKQYLRKWPTKAWDYHSFSYLPEEGSKTGKVEQSQRRIVAADSLPLVLRDFDFENKGKQQIALLPDQTSNRAVAHDPVDAEVRYAKEDGEAHKLEVFVGDSLLGTYWMAKDRLHVMTHYASGDGRQMYQLKSVERVNYWTRKE